MATRTQVYLTDDQRARLTERAARQHIPVSQVIREAVDAYLEEEDDIDATFGSVPGLGNHVPMRSEWPSRG